MQENRSLGFLTRSDTNRPVQSQKQAGSLKFRIQEEEKLYYPCSENNGTVTAQLICSHRCTIRKSKYHLFWWPHCWPCADPEIFMRGGPTKMVIFGHRRGGVQPPKKFRNYLFLGKIFKFQGGSGPPVPPSGSAHADFDIPSFQEAEWGILISACLSDYSFVCSCIMLDLHLVSFVCLNCVNSHGHRLIFLECSPLFFLILTF